jgi:hypothetical protein
MKVQIERKHGDAWRQTSVQLKFSRRGNNWFSLHGATYVFKDFQQECLVLVKTKEGWAKAGRITRGCIFLGPGKTYSETIEEQAFKEGMCIRPVFA